MQLIIILLIEINNNNGRDNNHRIKVNSNLTLNLLFSKQTTPPLYGLKQSQMV